MNARLFRILSTVLVTVIVIAVSWALIVAATLPARISDTELKIACASARANVSQLEALRHVARTLGLPADTVEVPPLPPECA